MCSICPGPPMLPACLGARGFPAGPGSTRNVSCCSTAHSFFAVAQLLAKVLSSWRPHSSNICHLRNFQAHCAAAVEPLTVIRFTSSNQFSTATSVRRLLEQGCGGHPYLTCVPCITRTPESRAGRAWCSCSGLRGASLSGLSAPSQTVPLRCSRI